MKLLYCENHNFPCARQRLKDPKSAPRKVEFSCMGVRASPTPHQPSMCARAEDMTGCQHDVMPNANNATKSEARGNDLLFRCGLAGAI